jgi:protein KTI12
MIPRCPFPGIMPLVIVSGLPCSGKTTRAHQLATFLTTKFPDKNVQVISEESLGAHRATEYTSSTLEKKARGNFFSSIERHVTRDSIIIADGLNYIKGYRYQLYCIARAASTPHCVLYCVAREDVCRKRNSACSLDTDGQKGDLSLLENSASSADTSREKDDASSSENSASSADTSRVKDDASSSENSANPPGNNASQPSNNVYPPEIFEELLLRYEEPSNQARWDSPLFTVGADEEGDWEGMAAVLSGIVARPPSMSTTVKSANNGAFFVALDKITQEVVEQILRHVRQVGVPTNVKIQDSVLMVRKNLMSSDLQTLRRQFIHMNRLHQADADNICSLFVQYLQHNLK